jgi:hypothetical protein
VLRPAGLGQDNAFTGELFLQRTQAILETGQLVPQPDAARTPLGETNTPSLRSSLLARAWPWAGKAEAYFSIAASVC